MRIGVSEKIHRALQRLHLHGIGGGNSLQHNVHCDVKVRKVDLVPSDVPAGFLVVYVGDERRRFVIRAYTLKHAVFRVLLEKSAEEFGYKHDGGLIIACDVAFFEHLLWLIETKSPSLCRMELRHYWAFAPDNTICHMVD
ncbi:protein SMALL AUXIN UP-REGULATED RNA 12 [Physcomitrium patens]|uniref:Uncharacterized protein n=1 Tax=Physcomitrium patens TaxID=3218 RepID=A0A2K1KTI3_PHYPA|nr:auxin-responsive protein SAUR50-like [Physcomitrium patens]PNR57103.1 hypothetical protein PHYPA_004096 [Physcomitrium patens]|eukprot:XP_024371599.1 auxin-responsive protein SAUR50-like [Physcomitrella patens]